MNFPTKDGPDSLFHAEMERAKSDPWQQAELLIFKASFKFFSLAFYMFDNNLR